MWRLHFRFWSNVMFKYVTLCSSLLLIYILIGSVIVCKIWKDRFNDIRIINDKWYASISLNVVIVRMSNFLSLLCFCFVRPESILIFTIEGKYCIRNCHTYVFPWISILLCNYSRRAYWNCLRTSYIFPN